MMRKSGIKHLTAFNWSRTRVPKSGLRLT